MYIYIQGNICSKNIIETERQNKMEDKIKIDLRLYF